MVIYTIYPLESSAIYTYLNENCFKETKISYLVAKQDWNALAELKAVDAIIKVLDVLLNNEAIFEEDRGQGWGGFHWKTDGNDRNRGTKIA